VDDREAYEFYAGPANQVTSGPGRRRQGQNLSDMTSIRFAPEVIEAVKERAFSEGVTVGSWIRRLVGRELEARSRERPQGLIEGSGIAGEQRAVPSTLSRPRTFSCAHFSVGNVVSASCETCGPLEAAA
jgi:hypothetical protein